MKADDNFVLTTEVLLVKYLSVTIIVNRINPLGRVPTTDNNFESIYDSTISLQNNSRRYSIIIYDIVCFSSQ